MKKILLIEDRKERQDKFINLTSIDLGKYSNILDNCTGVAYDRKFDEFKKDNYVLEEYDVIIVHKSAFDEKDYNTKIIGKLDAYARKHQKVIVYFSGGIDASYYVKEDNFMLMELNSKTFYSENLRLFLNAFKNGESEPLILSYGSKWKLNIALNALETLNLYLGKMTAEKKIKKLYSAFIKDNPEIEKLYTLEIPIFTPKRIDEREIDKEKMEEIKTDIEVYIKESLNYGS